MPIDRFRYVPPAPPPPPEGVKSSLFNLASFAFNCPITTYQIDANLYRSIEGKIVVRTQMKWRSFVLLSFGHLQRPSVLSSLCRYVDIGTANLGLNLFDLYIETVSLDHNIECERVDPTLSTVVAMVYHAAGKPLLKFQSDRENRSIWAVRKMALDQSCSPLLRDWDKSNWSVCSLCRNFNECIHKRKIASTNCTKAVADQISLVASGTVIGCPTAWLRFLAGVYLRLPQARGVAIDG